MTSISEYQIDKYSKYNQNKTKFGSKEIEICQNYIKEQKSKMDKIKNKYNSIEFLQIFLNYNEVKLTVLFTEGIFDKQNLLDDVKKEKE